MENWTQQDMRSKFTQALTKAIKDYGCIVKSFHITYEEAPDLTLCAKENHKNHVKVVFEDALD